MVAKAYGCESTYLLHHQGFKQYICNQQQLQTTRPVIELLGSSCNGRGKDPLMLSAQSGRERSHSTPMWPFQPSANSTELSLKCAKDMNECSSYCHCVSNSNNYATSDGLFLPVIVEYIPGSSFLMVLAMHGRFSSVLSRKLAEHKLLEPPFRLLCCFGTASPRCHVSLFVLQVCIMPRLRTEEEPGKAAANATEPLQMSMEQQRTALQNVLDLRTSITTLTCEFELLAVMRR